MPCTRFTPFALLAPLALLAACATTPPPPAAPRPVALTPVAGLERILGRPANEATALLGPATLDRREGTARAVQFANAGCVLDVYYYPDPAAGQPTARFAEARLPTGVADVAARCFAAQLAARGHG
jgi:hypothetical protein